MEPEQALHADAGIEQALFRDTRLFFTAYVRREKRMLWTPGSAPQRPSPGVIQPGSIDAPWVNVLNGTAHGLEVVLRRDVTNGFGGWLGNVLNHENLRNAAYVVDRAGRVFGTTESLMPIVPSAGAVIEF